MTTKQNYDIQNLAKLVSSQVGQKERLQFLERAEAYNLGRWDLVFFAEYWLGLDLNDFQKRVLTETFGNFSNLIIAGNRSGKTWIISILHIWHGFYKVGFREDSKSVARRYNTFNLSPLSRQAKETFKYVVDMLSGKFAWENNGVYKSNAFDPETGKGLKIQNFIEHINQASGELRTVNKWSFYSVSTHQNESVSIQGAPAGYISYDECIESKHLQSDIVSQVSRLGDYGVRHDLVTAFHATELYNSQQLVFHLYSEAKQNRGDWKLVSGTFDENIFIPAAQREAHKRRVKAVSGEYYDQIILGKPVTGRNKMFELDVIDHIWNGRKEPKPPMQEHNYIISVDWGLAEKGDETVFLVIDYTNLGVNDSAPWEIVLGISERGGDPWSLMAKLREIARTYNDAELVMDTNALGGEIFRKMMIDLRPHKFDSHGEDKLTALTNLQLILTTGKDTVTVDGEQVERNPAYGLLRSYYLPTLEEQLSQYQLKDTKLKTDWVAALWQAAYYLWRLRKKYTMGAKKTYSYKQF